MSSAIARFTVQQPELADPLDDLRVVIEILRFGMVRVRPQFICHLFILGIIRAAKNNHDQSIELWLLAHPPKHFPFSRAGHFMIQHD